MELVNALADAYALNHSSVLPAYLQQIHQETLEKHPHAHLQSSLLQGSFLHFIVSILQPQAVLEVGTFSGYSALCMAEAFITSSAQLHTIELREADALAANQNFSKSIKNKQITLHLGNAKEIIPKLEMKWDLVFLDADKTAYIDYYEMLLPKMNKGALLIADNVLFHGQVLEATISGKNAKAIDAFNKHVAADERVEKVLLTLRDGLLMIKKK